MVSKRVLLLGVLILVTLQFFPRIERRSRAATGGLDAPEEVLVIVQRSCFDCHSTRTRWPWYGYIAPISWLLSHDVNEAREKLNFSAWSQLAEDSQSHLAREIVRQVERGDMPLSRYLWLHPDARLSRDELEILRRWARTQAKH